MSKYCLDHSIYNVLVYYSEGIVIILLTVFVLTLTYTITYMALSSNHPVISIWNKYTLDNTEVAIKNDQSRENSNKTKKKQNKNTTQYVLDTTMRKQT